MARAPNNSHSDWRFLRVIASTGNGQCRTILHIDIATPQKDASGTIILHRQCRAILHCQNVGTILTSHTHIVMTNLACESSSVNRQLTRP